VAQKFLLQKDADALMAAAEAITDSIFLPGSSRGLMTAVSRQKPAVASTASQFVD
jgi:hypothetical protein